jgi:preprotein translocase subunit SecE
VATHENAPNKPVHLMYLVGVVVLFYISQWTIDWIWGAFFSAPSDFTVSLIAGVIAAVVGISMYRSDRIYHLANEVATELKKVTWPTAKETRAATIVVIIMSILSAVILGLFDLLWSNLTNLVYG